MTTKHNGDHAPLEYSDRSHAKPASVIRGLKRSLAKRATPPKGASIEIITLWHKAKLEAANTRG